MQILLIRTDRDGYVYCKLYEDQYAPEVSLDIAAHLNTLGVVKLELIPVEGMSGAHMRQRRSLPHPWTKS